jgi:septal ring factor EnvC (AmiA/AmiB activator)
MIATQQQFSLIGSQTAQTPLPAGNAAPDQDLDVTAEATAQLEAQLADKKSLLDTYRKDEQKCEHDSEKMLKKLNSLAKEDKRLKKIEPKLRFTAMPTPFVMGIGAVMHNPIVAAVGGLVMLGSFAAKVYCQKRIPKLDQEFWPLKSRYEQSFDQLRDIKNDRHKVEVEVSGLESRVKHAKDQVIEVKVMAERLNREAASGASEIVDTDDYLVIGGLKIDKRSEKEDAVFGLAQDRAKLLRRY